MKRILLALFGVLLGMAVATLAKAGEAAVATPAKIEHVWVVFKTHLEIGYTHRVKDLMEYYRTTMIDRALGAMPAVTLPGKFKLAMPSIY